MSKAQKFYNHQFANGITLLGEEIEGVASAAISILFPVGSAKDPVGLEGLSSILVELMAKGAGQYDSREIADEFDKIGAHRGHSTGIETASFSASLLAENLPRVIELFSLMIQQPLLPEEELENVKELALQDIVALEDEPASKVMNELARVFYPYPFGRSQLGTTEGITAITHKILADFYRDFARNEKLLISVAGKFNWQEIKNQIENLFSSWKGTKDHLTVPSFSEKGNYLHLEQETKQVQIALAYPSVTFTDPDYYVARVLNGILSGGMAGRLFVEVREKRGLVYRVSSSHSAARGRGAVFAYAGTTPDNAQTTYDVMMKELTGIENGVSEEELNRSKVDIKTAVIMQSESSSARASALVNDWWNLSRLRTIEEIRKGIESVTAEDIVRFVKKHPVSPVTMVTLGPKKVNI
ncbi:MAG: insulinase family protein [Proteobacteria bacterium]|nr:insulinase family protein [Pseudomonadota bacterium]